MKYVIDTNIASDWMKGVPRVVDRLRRAAKDSVYIPQPVLAELAYGIERLPRSKRRERLEERLHAIRREVRRSAWTDEVSLHFGVVKAALERRGERIEDFDAAIAAHALSIEAVLVTTNLEHMKRVPGLRVEDWSALDWNRVAAVSPAAAYTPRFGPRPAQEARHAEGRALLVVRVGGRTRSVWRR